MDLMDMSIEGMTSMSCLLFAISGAFAVSAVILFFVLDIAKCWRMVSGRHTVCRRKTDRSSPCIVDRISGRRTVRRQKRQKADQSVIEKKIKTEKLTGNDLTVPLGHIADGETELIDTVSLEVIQDIVYMQDTTKIE